MQTIKCLFIISCMVFAATPTGAIQVNLTADKIEAAKKFGEAHKNASVEKLENIYALGDRQRFGEYLVIHTKWYKLANLAGIKAAYGKIFPVELQAGILSDNRLQIDVIVHGHKIDFARDYKVTMDQKGRVIQPVKIHADHSQNHRPDNKALAGFPAYRAAVRTYFAYDQIDPLSKAVIVIKKDGSEQKFKVDFSLVE